VLVEELHPRHLLQIGDYLVPTMGLVPPLLSQAALMIKDPVIPHIVKTALNLTSALTAG